MDSSLTPEQLRKKQQIDGLATVVAVLAGAPLAALAWMYFSRELPWLRYFGTGGLALAGFFIAHVATSAALGARARCPDCSAMFSVSQTGREETFLSATPRRRESEVGRSLSGPNEGKRLIRKESWTEERYQVDVTRGCSACGASRTTRSTKTVKANRVSDDIYRR